jgi:hypothetical protein
MGSALPTMRKENEPGIIEPFQDLPYSATWKHRSRKDWEMDSINRLARTTGFLYLVIAVANFFVFFFIVPSVSVPGDATATANNILASESLYRAGIASYLVVFLSDIAVAVLLYVLLKPVSRTLALIMMVARLAQTAIHGMNLLNYVFPLLLLNSADSLTVFEPGQLHALALLFSDAHNLGVLISEAFFGLSTVLLGYLVFKSGFFPRILGVLLVIAALGYFVDSFGILLFPDYAGIIAQVVPAALIIGELSFTFWLLVKGVDAKEWKRRAVESDQHDPSRAKTGRPQLKATRA